MNAIHVRKHIDSDLVNAIPELREFLGRDAEIIVRAEDQQEDEEPVETLKTFLGEGLHRPPPGPDEMAELRAMAETDPFIAAALRMAERGGLDVETILAVRNAR